MAFFPPNRLKPTRIEIDESSVHSASPEVTKRLDRIESNYAQLDEILRELESKMENDERLKAIDDASAEEFQELFAVKKKRKWKSQSKAKPSSKRRSTNRRSANPRKPR